VANEVCRRFYLSCFAHCRRLNLQSARNPVASEHVANFLGGLIAIIIFSYIGSLWKEIGWRVVVLPALSLAFLGFDWNAQPFYDQFTCHEFPFHRSNYTFLNRVFQPNNR
jgi:hypothetical protein